MKNSILNFLVRLKNRAFVDLKTQTNNIKIMRTVMTPFTSYNKLDSFDHFYKEILITVIEIENV